jgi:hypothetical protein
MTKVPTPKTIEEQLSEIREQRLALAGEQILQAAMEVATDGALSDAAAQTLAANLALTMRDETDFIRLVARLRKVPEWQTRVAAADLTALYGEIQRNEAELVDMQLKHREAQIGKARVLDKLREKYLSISTAAGNLQAIRAAYPSLEL